MGAWFSSEVHCELETKTVSNFHHFLGSPTVTSQILFLIIIRQFYRMLYDYEGLKISDFNFPISPKCLFNSFGKMSKFWFIWRLNFVLLETYVLTEQTSKKNIFTEYCTVILKISFGGSPCLQENMGFYRE